MKVSQLKANDLRIGNLVKGGMHGRTVISIEDDGIIAQCHKDDEYPLFPHSVDPIPLTPEWLHKFGFDEDGCISINNPNTLQVTKSLDVNVYDERNDFICLGSVAFVHQLQNLYFALTGEELTIKTED